MSHRTIAVLVGLLFLSSTITFAIGNSLLQAYFSDPNPQEGELIAGVLLEGYTGIAVAAIGIAMLPVLRRHGHNLATGYLVLRVLECVVILAIGTWFATSRTPFESYALLIYAFSGAGGLLLSCLLLRSGLVARWLSQLGIVGYAALLLGVSSDLLGFADLDSDLGMVFFIPGGLFELILPILLIVKGFDRARLPAPVPA